MKISHKILEFARKNPDSFKATQNMDSEQRRYSRQRCWQYATRRYHDSGKLDAFRYLQDEFGKRRWTKIDVFENHLEMYINDFEDLGNFMMSRGTRIEMNLGYSNLLTGEIAREDMKPDGSFEVFVFEKTNTNWKDELRFPLIQVHSANTLGVDTSQVGVGVYCLELNQHASHTYSHADINSALREAHIISKIINKS